MDALTNLMMKLYQEQEKPEDALEYPLKCLSYYTNLNLPISISYCFKISFYVYNIVDFFNELKTNSEMLQ